MCKHPAMYIRSLLSLAKTCLQVGRVRFFVVKMRGITLTGDHLMRKYRNRNRLSWRHGNFER